MERARCAGTLSGNPTLISTFLIPGEICGSLKFDVAKVIIDDDDNAARWKAIELTSAKIIFCWAGREMQCTAQSQFGAWPKEGSCSRITA
jgi:hypothetical protein